MPSDYVDHGAVYTGRGSTLSKSPYNTTATGSSKINMESHTMRMFGLPYQFLDTADPRIESLNASIGRRYINNILMNAPIAYIIPGKPVFLPSISRHRKSSTAAALIDGANNNSFETIKKVLSDNPAEKLRYYDFQEDYTLYMSYVNAMCRTIAGFLDLNEEISLVGNDKINFQQYDWKNYRFDTVKWKANLGLKSLIHGIKDLKQAMRNKATKSVLGKTGDINLSLGSEETNNTPNLYRTGNFLAFYIDPSSSMSESQSNSASESQVKQMFDTVKQSMQEYKFLTQSAGIEMEGIDGFMDSAFSALDTMLNNFGALGNVVSRIATAGSAVVKGENIMMPQIYNSSSRGVEYSLEFHFKAPYGNKLSIYLDVLVPMMHLLGLVLPRQSTSNTYGSPFLIKVFYPGVYNCNLGLVNTISFNKSASPDSWTVDGLPNEVDVTLNIQDLYSDLSMSPSTDPQLFVNNGAMIDYLATCSGLSLISPQLSEKAKMYVNNYTDAIRDIPSNIVANLTSAIDRKFNSFLTL